MYSDKNLVNRRNVKGDVTAAVNPCRRFFEMEVEARLIAATLKILGMDDIDGKPKGNKFPDSADTAEHKREERKMYLHKVATLVVDTFVIDKKEIKILKRLSRLSSKKIKKLLVLMEGTIASFQAVLKHLPTMES